MKKYIWGFALWYAALCASGNIVADAISPFVEGGEVAGVVTLIADKDKILDFQTFGFFDIEKKIPMRSDSIFFVASHTKTFTAVLFMMLVEEGKVSLDDPVSKYIPELKEMFVENSEGFVEPISSPITLRQLLSHMSGVRKKISNPEDGWSLEQKVKVYAKMPLVSQPGTSYLYSNVGTNILGRVIEIVSGKDYKTLLEEKIIKPMGLKNTTFIPSKEQISRMPTGYKKSEKNGKLEALKIATFTYPLDNPKRNASPAAGLFSSAEDLMKFCQMFLNGGVYDGKRYLSEKSIKEMSRKQNLGNRRDYGLYMHLDEFSFGHGGGWGTRMSVIPSDGIVIVVLAQNGAGEDKSMTKKFTEAARKLATSIK